jgi:hypothetical protein
MTLADILEQARMNANTMSTVVTSRILPALLDPEPDTETALKWLEEVEKHIKWVREDIAVYQREKAK